MSTPVRTARRRATGRANVPRLLSKGRTKIPRLSHLLLQGEHEHPTRPCAFYTGGGRGLTIWSHEGIFGVMQVFVLKLLVVMTAQQYKVTKIQKQKHWHNWLNEHKNYYLKILTIKSKHLWELHFLMRWVGLFFPVASFIHKYYLLLERVRFTHILLLSVICPFYLLLIKIISIAWVYDIFFIHSPAGGRLDYFQFMDIINNAYQFVLILVTQPTRIFTTETKNSSNSEVKKNDRSQEQTFKSKNSDNTHLTYQ